MKIGGFVKKVRDLGKICFVVLYDTTGEVQVVFRGDSADAVRGIGRESVLGVEGLVVKSDKTREGIEVIPERWVILSVASPPPIPLHDDPSRTDLSKRLDYRWLDLRGGRLKYFRMLSDLVREMRWSFYRHGFTEIFTPKLLAHPSEGGSEVFTVLYFDREAYLAQSPQFYKQMAVISGLDRVFEIAPVFRANPSFTSRHDTEFTMLDVEVAWIESHHDIMDLEEEWIREWIKNFLERWEEVEEPSLPKKIPRIPMEEAWEIVGPEGRTDDGDLTTAGEREMGKYAKDAYDSDFVFVTDYPWRVRPFYHMKGELMSDGTPTTKSYDLLFKGLEITTVAQREHRYEVLREQVREKGLKEEFLQFYLEFFKYGAPPHGGFGLSPTRVLMKLLNLTNVREVTMLPRDPRRLTP